MHRSEDIKDKLRKAIDKPRFGLITDVDGTISSIVDVPDAARVTSANTRLLSQLRENLTLVAIVSGRSADDVAQRVGIPGLVYVGNQASLSLLEKLGFKQEGILRDYFYQDGNFYDHAVLSLLANEIKLR